MEQLTAKHKAPDFEFRGQPMAEHYGNTITTTGPNTGTPLVQPSWTVSNYYNAATVSNV